MNDTTADTSCWRCNHFYPIGALQCPSCGASNANVDPVKAQRELSAEVASQADRDEAL